MDQIPKLNNAPRTPPVVNLTPDFRSYRAFLKSPNPDVDDKFTLSEMDFESAYAMLTQSPNFHMTPTMNSVPSFPEPEFKDLLFHSQTPSPKIPSPMMSLETLQGFPKHDELLSAHETTALEHFLDSIIEMPNKLKKEKADTLAFPESLESMVPAPLGTSLPTSGVPPQHPLELEEETEQPHKSKNERKKRKLLSEEEKKMHHLTSEQRRRGEIKEAFDRLVSLLPLNHAKKTQSKSVVLETAGNEINRLVHANKELRRLLDM